MKKICITGNKSWVIITGTQLLMQILHISNPQMILCILLEIFFTTVAVKYVPSSLPPSWTTYGSKIYTHSRGQEGCCLKSTSNLQLSSTEEEQTENSSIPDPSDHERLQWDIHRAAVQGGQLSPSIAGGNAAGHNHPSGRKKCLWYKVWMGVWHSWKSNSEGKEGERRCNWVGKGMSDVQCVG